MTLTTTKLVFDFLISIFRITYLVLVILVCVYVCLQV